MRMDKSPRLDLPDEERHPDTKSGSNVTKLEAASGVAQPDTNDKAYRKAGMLVLLLCFGGLGYWSAVAPIDSAIVAVGKVQVESNRKTVQHLEGGLVSEIAVKDGDVVEKGQLLLRLDDIQARAKLDIIRWQSYSEQTKLARLRAERDGMDAVLFPELAASALGSNEITELRTQEARLFDFRKESLEDEIAILQQRYQQLQEQIKGIETVSRIKQARISLFEEEIKEWKSLFDRQLADKLQLRQIQHQKLALEGEVAGHVTEINRLKLESNEIQSQILLQRQNFMSDVLQQWRDSSTALADQRARMMSLNDRLARTAITAPAAGVVVGLDVHTIGAVISPGKPIMHIVPQSKEFIIKSQIATTDIDRVFVGQPVEIRFSAFDSRVTPVIDGQVKIFSADSFVDEKTGSQYYQVDIKVSEEGLETMRDKNMTLVSGMPAEVMINTGGRTLLEYIVQPFTDMLARGFKEK